MLACGAPVSASSPNLEALPSTACRVDGVLEAESLSGRKDRAARAEAGGRMPVGSIQKSHRFSPTYKRTARRPDRSEIFSRTTRESDYRQQRMSVIADTLFVYPAMDRKET
jgi:hypothetical protein